MTEEREYLSSATFLVLGEDLEPDTVSKELGISASQSWRPDGSHQWGGWKKRIADEHRNAPLETQIEFWCDLLLDRTPGISKLKSRGHYCALDLCVITDSTASIIIPESLQKKLAELELEIRFSIRTETGSEHTVAGPATHA